jgi:hypothetical protein
MSCTTPLSGSARITPPALRYGPPTSTRGYNKVSRLPVPGEFAGGRPVLLVGNHARESCAGVAQQAVSRDNAAPILVFEMVMGSSLA